MTSSRAALTFVMLSVFIDSAGFGIVIPSLPLVITDLTGESVAEAARWGGWLMAVYAGMQFFTAPIVGNLSDRYGRRPLLLGSLAAFGVDFLLTGLATSMLWLFVGRAFAGVFGASFSTAGAYIGDISDDSNRAKHFGFIGAAWGLGFTLGPVIGGFFSEHFGPRAPFFAAAGLALLNTVFGYFVLPESLPVERRRKFEWARANPFGAFKSLSHLPMLTGLLLAFFFYQIAHDSLPAVWTFFTIDKFGWSQSEIGWSLAWVGVMTILVMGVLTGVVVPKIGERNAIVFGFMLITMGFLAYAFATQSWMLYAAITIGSLGSIGNPSMQSVMSRQAGPSAQGELQGAIASIQSVAAIFSPLFMTALYHEFAREEAAVRFPGAPFLASAVLTMLCVAICWRAIPKWGQAPISSK